MTRPALTWRQSRDAWLGERNGLSLYRIVLGTGFRFVLSSYLHSALKAVPIFDTVPDAQAYAEVDFADWLDRAGLQVRK